MNRKTWILAAVVAIGAILRLWHLGVNPPGLYWDEVSLGWNAYSILKTGMDEHGRFLPLDTFYAFGDYKPPLYIYAAVPPIALFGLNEFAVRLPSALSGVGLIIIAYFLTRELSVGDHGEHDGKNGIFPIISALLIAVSPWSITLSRVGFESNLAVLLNAFGVLFFLYAVHRRSSRWLPLSVASFVLAAYTFNANRLLSPIFLIALTLLFYREALEHWKAWGVCAGLGLVLVIPMIGHLRSTQGKLRWNEVNIFSDLSVIEESNVRRGVDGNTLISRLFHHRYFGYARFFLSHYADNLDLKYLFLTGDPNPRISVPHFGELYIIELPFFIIGAIGLVKGIRKKNLQVLLTLFLLAPIPASLARETPHALRSASLLPIPQVLVAIGLMGTIEVIRKICGEKTKKFLLFAFCFMLISSIGNFLFIYYRYYPYEQAGEWLTSYPRLVRYIQSIKKDRQLVYVTPDLGRPYIYFLFYGRYDPLRYINDAKNGGRVGDAFGFFDVRQFGDFRFFIPELNSVPSNTLVVTRADAPPDGFVLLSEITESNGYPEFHVIQKK